MMRTMIGIAACMVALTACSESQHAARPETPAAQPAAKASDTVLAGNIGEETATATATVQSVNMKTRHVVLKGEDGKEFTIVASPEVRNLAQVKKGDVLRVTYKESMAYEVSKPGKKPGVAAGTAVHRAELGQKPAADVANTVTVRTTIAAIDKAKSQVTLRGPDGKTDTVKVRDPSKLDVVSVGDVVDITYTEALALAVEPAGKK
jgi:hypothetical protein